MKKSSFLFFTVVTLAAALTGCGTTQTSAQGTAAGTAAGGTIGAGVGLAATGGTPAGAAVGAGIGAGVGALVGTEASQRDIIIYRQKGVVYHDGKAYHIRDGKYVLAR
ncbi:hypothetical protein [Legionella londiniensis]|uniref:Glycine zipper domain-containing protein n=1 Tax=Legionella londiniensis TaxID=45068 RepID=A0A0W0VN94_9GAMM|nr:hypothetical protein [Legionella londiniensis]KTD21559.1 hypothetical protein Llon_0724 [Legionella londiniensis]STX92764.1 Uncharacterised protein [Legionella londiniensis]